MAPKVDKDSGHLIVVAFGDSTTAPREGVTVYPDLLLPPWQSLLLDGMHPNDEGHRLAARLLLPQLDALVAKLT